MSEQKEISLGKETPKEYLLGVNKVQDINSKASPLPKPDFSSIEKKESSFTYKQKGSYKKPKSHIPESPMKSPNQKFFTPVKFQKNLFTASNANTCRKLNFGGNPEEQMDVEEEKNFTDTFKRKGSTLLERLEEEDVKVIQTPTSQISPNIFNKAKQDSPSFMEKLGLGDSEGSEREGTFNALFGKNNNMNFSGNFSIKMDQCENYLNNRGDSPEVNMDSRLNMNSLFSKINNDIENQTGSDDMDVDYIEMKFQKQALNSKFEKEFEIIKTLDAGAFGIVYKCISKIDGLYYAVKKSKKHSSEYDYNVTNKLITDFHTKSSSLFSQFCVNYKECWLEEEAHEHTGTENHLYIVQEFCRFGDLNDYLEKLENLNNSGFKFNEVFYWDLIFELLCAVHFVHECGYIHLDIKPGNFLIEESGCVKLGDFGLSRKINDIKNSEDVYEGDCSYLAPEFFESSGKKQSTSDKFNTKCDVFSLGLTILEILCKVELPQNGALWKKLRSEDFTLPEEFMNNSNIKINEKMVLLIKEMLMVNPDKRPSILSILQNSYYEEINFRYIKLLKSEYSRFLNPLDLFQKEKYDNITYARRSNSYKFG